MNGNDIGQLFYLVLLAAAIGGYTIASYRGQMGTMARHAVLWLLIFVGMLAAIGLWSDVRQTITPMQQVSGAIITVPRASDGHYYVTASVNDTPVQMLIDTGASQVVLNHKDAEAAGIDLSGLRYTGRAQTANGMVRIASVKLADMTLGPEKTQGFRAFVSEGEMGNSLLGMAFLQRFERIEISNGAMVLTR